MMSELTEVLFLGGERMKSDFVVSVPVLCLQTQATSTAYPIWCMWWQMQSAGKQEHLQMFPWSKEEKSKERPIQIFNDQL